MNTTPRGGFVAPARLDRSSSISPRRLTTWPPCRGATRVPPRHPPVREYHGVGKGAVQPARAASSNPNASARARARSSHRSYSSAIPPALRKAAAKITPCRPACARTSRLRPLNVWRHSLAERHSVPCRRPPPARRAPCDTSRTREVMLVRPAAGAFLNRPFAVEAEVLRLSCCRNPSAASPSGYLFTLRWHKGCRTGLAPVLRFLGSSSGGHVGLDAAR
jgi:hypothetical protein